MYQTPHRLTRSRLYWTGTANGPDALQLFARQYPFPAAGFGLTVLVGRIGDGSDQLARDHDDTADVAEDHIARPYLYAIDVEVDICPSSDDLAQFGALNRGALASSVG